MNMLAEILPRPSGKSGKSQICLFCFIICVSVVSASEFLQYDKSKEDAKQNQKLSLIGSDLMSRAEKGMSTAESDMKGTLSVGFIHAFMASISVIIVSELGDKTFFIAAIMAMRYSRLTVFLGAIGALGLMTILSASLGYVTTIIPRKYTFYISTALFAIFGLKMLKEGWSMDPNEGQEEYEEVSAELKKKEEELEMQQGSTVTQDLETGIIRGHNPQLRFLRKLCSPIFIQSFTMTFLAEWGDRSQLTTIILGSREDPFGVTVGGTIGHAICTGLAVLGGRFIAQKISVRTVTLIGGVVFILFALSALFFDPSG